MDALANLLTDIVRHRVLGPADTAAFLGVSVPQLHRMRRDGATPPPVRFSPRRMGWRIGGLIDWLADHEIHTPPSGAASKRNKIRRPRAKATGGTRTARRAPVRMPAIPWSPSGDWEFPDDFPF